MTEQTAQEDTIRRCHRLPLSIVSTANGKTTEGVLVAVLVSDLDAYERAIFDASELAASVACHFEDEQRGLDVSGDRGNIRDEADGLWKRLVPFSRDLDHENELRAEST